MFPSSFDGRSPHGERGLKCDVRDGGRRVGRSLSSWRAWIEICRCRSKMPHHRSLYSWRAWIEIMILSTLFDGSSSLSSWRAWIEIQFGELAVRVFMCRSPHGERGLKCHLAGLSVWRGGSLSSWRAWIEIRKFEYSHRYGQVALLMESVD